MNEYSQQVLCAQMKPMRTPGTIAVLHGGRDAYGDLPFERCQPDCCMTLWDLSSEERIAIAEGAMVELHMKYHTPPPPIALEVSQRPRELDPPTHLKGK